MSSQKQKEENAVPIQVPSGKRDDGKDRDEEEEKKKHDGELKELHKGVEPFERHDKVRRENSERGKREGRPADGGRQAEA